MKSFGRFIRTVRTFRHSIFRNSLFVDRIISNGSEIYGEVHSSVLGGGVTIGKGSIVRDSILMRDVVIGDHIVIDKAIHCRGDRNWK